MSANLIVIQVNFGDVAKMLNIKHSKNARAATKALFAKLKAQAPTSADIDDGNEADEDATGEGDDEEEAAEKATSGRASRAKSKVAAFKKVVTKKGVSKSAAPKKATATKKTAKAVLAEPVEEEEENAEEEGDAQTEDGKSTVSVSVVQISTPAVNLTHLSVEPEPLGQSELESSPQAKNRKALPPPPAESLTEPDSEYQMDIDQEQDGTTERELEQKRLLGVLSPEQKQSAYKSLYSRIAYLLKQNSPAVQEPVLPYYYPAAPMPTLSMKIKGLDFQFTQEDINRAEFYELSLYDYLAWKLANPQYFNQ